MMATEASLMEEIGALPEVRAMLDSAWEAEAAVTPLRRYNSV